MTVVKVGGELLEDPTHVGALAAFISRSALRRPLVIVHGGGREIDAALATAGVEKRQVDGLRITDGPTLAIVVAVLAGMVNTRLVAAVNAAGGRAVGLTGADGALALVERSGPHLSVHGKRVDLGLVGEPIGTDPPALVLDLCGTGYIPVIASIGMTRTGQLLNVNADTLAAHLAVRLKAGRLVMAGGTAGVLDGRGQTIGRLDAPMMSRMMAAGSATAGMVAKLNACRAALSGGVSEVVVASGRDIDQLERWTEGDLPAEAAAGGTRVVTA